ncbi:MAG: hypothetical protein HQK76_04145 [Desulfobacterales bacterium]|nr:hypothetical protein [Desulfobacterales bacterium]
MIELVAKLFENQKQIFSQHGEDGILEYMLSKIPDKTKWCVDCGAWDGIQYSNTYYFISKYGYRSILIEAWREKYNQLKKNIKAYQDCCCFNTRVTIDGENSLDNLLSRTKIPKKFDFISIDIDGDDYHVWDSLKKYEPKIVIIEINVADSPDTERISKPDTPIARVNKDWWWGEGASLLSTTKLAKSKGYSLIAQVGCNAIYVKNCYLTLFYDREVSPEEVYYIYDPFKIQGVG